MVREPMPHLTRAGKYLLYALGATAVVIVFGLAVNACVRRPPVVAERGWTQGYEHPSAGYMEPDHGALYYWWMTRALQQTVQPTYHVYVPPPNYPTTYRPWHPDREYVRDAGGRFVRQTAATPARTSGGFAQPTPSAPPPPPRPAPTRAPAPRSSGGFSQPAQPPAARPSPSPSSSPSRSTGGFSKQSSPSKPSTPPRSSGGFSKR